MPQQFAFISVPVTTLRYALPAQSSALVFNGVLLTLRVTRGRRQTSAEPFERAPPAVWFTRLLGEITNIATELCDIEMLSE
jgi:hypothetical protein